MISLLVAMDENRVIGHQNKLPWHIPRDLQYFKQLTLGHTIIMGRKTYESIGRPLPQRRNVVLTRQDMSFPEGVEVIHDLDTLYEWEKANPDEEYFVIGGGNLFNQVIEHADRMYITLIKHPFKGDTFFPEFNEADWTLTHKEKGIKDEQNPYDYYFLTYDRK